MDWDIEPTAFNEFVTIQGTNLATNVLFASDNGFASANPLSGPSSILFTGDAVDSGPSDHGALFDFGFGSLGSGDSRSFNIFYGAASTEVEALAALAAVNAEVYSLGQASVLGGSSTGTPNTAIFAFSEVGGVPIKKTPEPVSILALLTLGALGTTSLKRKQKEEK
ncbi:MAG: PEP-CTERM sorting domain-containing protein [Okeania sp. SIO3B3]|nr:PEP-CTERM sorting domain-containing protein [Okeania sp. SIO3B3]